MSVQRYSPPPNVGRLPCRAPTGLGSRRSTIDSSVLQFQHVPENPTHYPNRLLIKGVLTVSKVLYCNDLVPGCTFEAHGDSEEEILAAAADHITTVHNMTDVSDDILEMVCAAIHEEVRTKTANA